MTKPIIYSEYPKWLDDPDGIKENSVIVYDEIQEKVYLENGYVLPGSSDPHGYLVAKATEKLDDAIRSMNRRVEEKLASGLNDLWIKITSLVEKEMKQYKYNIRRNKNEIESISTLNSNIKEVIEDKQKKLTFDIMDTIRDISKAN